MTSGRDMQAFWDERARENALFYVDNRLRYRDPEEERFWTDGERDLGTILELAGAEVRAADVVVDIGCGVGRLTRPLAARCARVLAIDVSAEMLARARAFNPRLTNVTWLHGDGVSLQPIADASTDVCISHVVFQHIPDPAITLGYVREMGRVLRPGGWATFQVSTDPSVHRPPTGLRSRLPAWRRTRPRGQRDPRWLGSAVSVEALRACAADAGLALERLAAPGTQYSLVTARRLAD